MKSITSTITRALVLAASLAAVLVPATAAQAHSAPKTKRVSVKSNGEEINVDNDFGASVSADGRYVAFPSQGKYTHGDGGSDYDVFVHDRLTGKTRRASLKSNGKEVDGQDCLNHSISANGNLVAFTCDGAMVGSDNNGYPDVYVKNMSSGKIVRASVKSDGSEIAGRAAACRRSPPTAATSPSSRTGPSSAPTRMASSDIYRHDLKTGKTIRISLRSNGDQTDQDSTDPSISGDGNRVAFASLDGSLTDDTDYANAVDSDVFVRDVKDKTTTRASLKSDGTEADPNDNQTNQKPAISANGRFVAFSADDHGTFVPGDMNAESDVYVHDLKSGKTTRASITSSGDELPAPSGANNPASISGNGRFVAFESYAPLVSSDTNNADDIYVHDRKTEKTRRVSIKSNGQQEPTYNSQLPSISEDGRWVTFSSPGQFTGGDSGRRLRRLRARPASLSIRRGTPGGRASRPPGAVLERNGPSASSRSGPTARPREGGTFQPPIWRFKGPTSANALRNTANASRNGVSPRRVLAPAAGPPEGCLRFGGALRPAVLASNPGSLFLQRLHDDRCRRKDHQTERDEEGDHRPLSTRPRAGKTAG